MAGKSYEFMFALAASMNSNFTSTFTVAQKSVSNLRNSIKDLHTTQASVQDAFDKGIINPKSFENAQKQMGLFREQLKRAKTERFQKSFIDANAFYYGAKNIAMNFAEPVQAAMQFESVMADVKKVVDFDTPGQFKQMGKDIITLSKNIPMTADGLAKIVAAGGQSGIARADLTQFASDAAKMGIAFDVTADQAGDMMAKWRTAFKMNQKEVVTLADKINYLGNTTAASAPLISDVVTRIGPLGAVGGLASGEIAAMGASLIGSGIQSEVAATGLKNFILAMTAGASATKTQKETFKELGFEAEEMAAKMQKDAKGAIIELLTAINGMDKVKQSAILKDLFGKESISAIAPLLSNLENLKKNFDGVADASKFAGSMQAEFDARSKTTENSVLLMENRVKAAKIAIGNGLLPVVAEITEVLGGMATTIGDLAEEYPNVTKNVILFGSSVMGLIGAVHIWNVLSSGWDAVMATKDFWLKSNTAQTISNTVATKARTAAEKISINVGKAWKLVQQSNTIELVKNEIAILRKAAAEKIAAVASRAWAVAINVCTTAQRLFNLALAGTPIGWVLIGISALVVAGTLLYKHWDKVKSFFTNLWESPTARMLMFVTGPIGWVIGAVTAIIANWDKIKDFFEYLWDNPTAAIFRFTSKIKELFQGAIDWVKEKWQAFSDFLSKPIFGRVEISSNAPNAGVGNGRATLGSIKGNASGGIYGKGAFLTTFAEESGESAIPHTPTKRNIGLLAKTNQIMGNPLQPNVNVYSRFNPVINAKAETPNINIQAPALTLPDIPPAVMAAQKAPVVNPVFNPTVNAMASTPSVTIPNPVIQMPESKPIMQAPPVVKNMIQAVADSPIVKTFVKAVAAVPDIIVNPQSPVLKPIFTAMAKVPDVIVNTETNPVFRPQAPIDNFPAAPAPIVRAMATAPASLFNHVIQSADVTDVNFPEITAPKETLIERIRKFASAPAPGREAASVPTVTIHNEFHFSGQVNQQEVRETVDRSTDISMGKFRELMLEWQREQRRVQYE